MSLSRYACVVLMFCVAASSATAQDWPMWGGSPTRNNVSVSTRVPIDWDGGQFDLKTGAWMRETARNVRWVAKSGSIAYGGPVVANGRVFLGSNNSAGLWKHYPVEVDLGCVICFRESDGQFLWQYSSPKLATGRVHDWPYQGICSTPLVQGNRMWFVDNRGRVVCLDTEGFHDGEDDGTEQGVGEILIETESLLEARTRVVLQLVRDASQKAGVTLLPGCSISVDRQDGRWLVRARREGPMSEVHFIIRRESHQLVGYRKAESGTIEEGEQLFRVENRLFPGLEQGQFGPEFREFLQTRGIAPPEPSAIMTEKAGSVWTFSADDDDVNRSYRVVLEGARLTVQMRSDTGHASEADVVWRYDMMKQLGVLQHNMASCSPVAFENTLFINTSNGVDESHLAVPAPLAPSFIAIDKLSGELLWTDNSPGENILHGQWSSPAVGVLGGVPQVIFGGGDGWLYSFRADTWNKETKQPILLWKFDCNPKESKWILGGRGNRNEIVATPVIHEGRVYLGVGQDPDHGEGEGHLWCIDPTRRGDVSPQLAMKSVDGKQIPIPHRRTQAVIKEQGEFAIENPNSAVVWHYGKSDQNGDGKIDFYETMNRTISSPAIQDDLLFIPDISGIFHCLDARTGRLHWTADLMARCWSSPVIVGDKVFVGDEDGEVAIFQRSSDPAKSIKSSGGRAGNGDAASHEPLREVRMSFGSIYATPIVANDVLYVATRRGLLAIESRPAETPATADAIRGNR